MLSALFRTKRSPAELDDFKSERWESKFSLFHEKRFHLEATEDYQIAAGKNLGLQFTLNKSHFFAWTVDAVYQYADFVLEADLEFDPGNGHSAVGFLLRYQNDENYYYVLVSNRHYLRFDAVFNGHPQVLIPWTPLPGSFSLTGELMVLAHGTQFSFFYNKEWAAEVSTEFFSAGRVGWACQNYGEKPQAKFLLRRIVLESRPFEVEAQHERWVKTVPADPAHRKILAQKFFEQGLFTEAEVQMHLAVGIQRTEPEDSFFLLQCKLYQGFYAEAGVLLEKVLADFPEWEPAVREKANLLYLQNRFLELRNYLEGIIDKFLEKETLWNLLGHAQDNLGNFDRAADAYNRAATLNAGVPIFRLNQARTLEKAGKLAEACVAYIEAGKEFFRQEAWQDLENTLLCVQSLQPSNPEVLALEGKTFYQKGDLIQAERKLAKAASGGSRDSAVYYLLALIENRRSHPEKALPLLEEAVALEEGFFLYHYRLAETLHSLGRDPWPHLNRARELQPGDPWVLYLTGLLTEEPSQREFFFQKAHLCLPEAPDIALALADQLYRSGKKKEAWDLLEGLPESPDAVNLQGNYHSWQGDWTRAWQNYEKALRARPDDVNFQWNCAKACEQLENFSRAESLYLRLLDTAPSAQLYTDFGRLLRTLGDPVRAEVTLQAGLGSFGDHPQLLAELIRLFLDRSRFTRAEETLKRLRATGARKVYEELENSLKRRTHERLNCASCGREWWVPMAIGDQGVLKIHGEPPEDAPAGQSPVTGKIFCIGCAQNHLRENRFICPDSGEQLRLKDDRLKYLLKQSLSAVGLS